jgi:hypothetical protein
MNKSLQVLESLRKHVENSQDGWGTVYLDNAKPDGMSSKSFRAYLSQLSKAGLYKPEDEFAFGSVKLEV